MTTHPREVRTESVTELLLVRVVSKRFAEGPCGYPTVLAALRQRNIIVPRPLGHRFHDRFCMVVRTVTIVYGGVIANDIRPCEIIRRALCCTRRRDIVGSGKCRKYARLRVHGRQKDADGTLSTGLYVRGNIKYYYYDIRRDVAAKTLRGRRAVVVRRTPE